MRIRKVSQPTPIVPGTAQITDTYSTSTDDGYSCNYVNNAISDAVVDEYSTSEVKTNKVWIDGRPIYRKTFVYGTSYFTTQRQDIVHNIANIGMVIHHECFLYRPTRDTNTWRQFPSIYYGNLQGWGGQLFVTSTLFKFELGTNLLSELRTTNAQTFVTVEYTKTTD